MYIRRYYRITIVETVLNMPYYYMVFCCALLQAFTFALARYIVFSIKKKVDSIEMFPTDEHANTVSSSRLAS